MTNQVRTKVVGVTFRNADKDGGEDRQNIIAGAVSRGGAFVELEREYDNPHDEHAVSVWMDGEKIGHLNGELAEDIAPLIDEGYDVKLTDCQITGGTLDHPTFGVNLVFELIEPR